MPPPAPPGAPPDRAGLRALDWLNFFVANLQTGFGPFIAVYLTTQKWTQGEIGVALSVGSAATLLAQVPAGALVDAMPRKRLAAALALALVGLSAALLAVWPERLPVMLEEALHGFASCVLVPAIAAITLNRVGRRAFAERLGRNARFAAPRQRCRRRADGGDRQRGLQPRGVLVRRRADPAGAAGGAGDAAARSVRRPGAGRRDRPAGPSPRGRLAGACSTGGC